MTEQTVARDWTQPLGATGLTATQIWVGGGPLGSMPENFGYEVPEDDAISLVQQVLASPIRVIDTAAGYSNGRSEERIGKGIRRSGGLPPDFLVVTKVDAKNGDYSGDRVRASVEESVERLGLSHLPLVMLHDPEFHDFEDMTAPGGAADTLVDLRRSGAIGHLGLAGGDSRIMSRYLDLGIFEVLLTHNRWTLVDRSAGPLIAQAHAAGIPVVNAAIYGGGILAAPHSGLTSYCYKPATQVTLQAVEQMSQACERWGTDLATAALRFSLRDPQITSTVVGISKASRLKGLFEARDAELPDQLWGELEELLPGPENWLDSD